MTTPLYLLQRKYGHLKQAGDHLIEGVSGDFVKISTNNYNFPNDILNLKTGERYAIKYDGTKIPFKTLFEVSKKLNGYYNSVSIPMYGKGYVIRWGTYRVGERVDGKLEAKRFSTVDKAIAYIKHLQDNNIKPELI